MARSVFALPEALTVQQVAEMLGLSVPTVYRWATTKRLPCMRLSRRALRFNRADIEAFAKNHTSGRP